MWTRLRQSPWGRLCSALVAVAAVAYLFVSGSLVQGMAVLAAIAGTLYAAGNPLAARARPELTLETDAGEVSELNLGSRRAVDVEAVVADARALAEAAGPQHALAPLLSPLLFQRPTPEDAEDYAAAVEEYTEKVRSWAGEADAWLRQRAMTLEARVVQRNPSTVDAIDAGIYVIFPVGTQTLEGDLADAPEPPERLAFSPKRTTFLRNTAQAAGWGHSPLPVVSPVARPGPEISFWEADYRRRADGSLEVTYPRQPVRHGEQEYSGRPLTVRIPAGEHEVRWEVRASNLAKARTGSWRVACREEVEEPSIATLDELRAALGFSAGEENGDG